MNQSPRGFGIPVSAAPAEDQLETKGGGHHDTAATTAKVKDASATTVRIR
jgi:hypothetical protein